MKKMISQSLNIHKLLVRKFLQVDEIPAMLKELNELGVQALKNPDETD